jgi:hypothetical protein
MCIDYAHHRNRSEIITKGQAPSFPRISLPCCKRNVSIIMCLVEFFFNGSKIPELQRLAIKILSDKCLWSQHMCVCVREREREELEYV